VKRTERDGAQDEQVESAGKELGLVVHAVGHVPPKLIRRVGSLS